MEKLIILAGTGGRGKTTTLNTVVDVLEKSATVKRIVTTAKTYRGGHCDRVARFEISGKVVGVITDCDGNSLQNGKTNDDRKDIDTGFPMLAKLGGCMSIDIAVCKDFVLQRYDIVFCGSHYGGSQSFVFLNGIINKNPDIEVIPYFKPITAPKDFGKYAVDNGETAKKLVELSGL